MTCNLQGQKELKLELLFIIVSSEASFSLFAKVVGEGQTVGIHSMSRWLLQIDISI